MCDARHKWDWVFGGGGILIPIGVPVQRLVKVEASENIWVANNKKSLQLVDHGWRKC